MSFFLKSGTDGSYNLTMAGYTGLVIIFVLIFILGNMIFGKNKKSSPKKLAFSGGSDSDRHASFHGRDNSYAYGAGQ
jgi:hypothetical protein